MPLPLLVAVVVAFGLDTPGDLDLLAPAEVLRRLLETLGGVVVVAVTAGVLGLVLASAARREGGPTVRLRRTYLLGSRACEVLALGTFAWIIHSVGWRQVVRSGFNLRGAILADEVLILAPFLLSQLAVWAGLYPAERALRSRAVPSAGGVFGHVARRARQTMGLILPVVLIFALGQDLVGRFLPSASGDAWVQVGVMAAMGALVLVFSPAFVRMAWPTRRLEDGPLRDRLERLAARHRFRCTDILVWETGGTAVNAGVTGALPWFRYVLLTDALIERLDARQVAAVFGHEVGHIAHRHLLSFGLFFLGSLGILALMGQGIEAYVTLPAGVDTEDLAATTVLQSAVFLGLVVAYFLGVFGLLSRRFERQADVYGCRAVSCDVDGCPPHIDVDGKPGAALTGPAPGLCILGIRIFAEALADVARLNGIDRDVRSWRHGSIGRRIAFVEGLAGRPEAERRFQAGTVRLRLGLLVLLAGSVALAVAAGSVEYLGR
ncbi:M48 family metallopeptidase [Isosphaeraceae bacterium EP7]